MARSMELDLHVYNNLKIEVVNKKYSAVTNFIQTLGAKLIIDSEQGVKMVDDPCCERLTLILKGRGLSNNYLPVVEVDPGFA
jgi:hypothetical protein